MYSTCKDRGPPGIQDPKFSFPRTSGYLFSNDDILSETFDFPKLLSLSVSN